MFKIMQNEAPSYLISLIPKREQTFNTRNNIYQPITAEQIVLRIHFSLYSNWLIQSRCQYKKLRINLNFQK